jgi:hypothetical protein
MDAIADVSIWTRHAFAIGGVMSRFVALVIAVSAAAFVAPTAVSRLVSRSPEAPPVRSDQCLIKGNISINSRERIYHVPGQEYYQPTIIRPEYGERWFCSEGEARAAGWRKAGR